MAIYTDSRPTTTPLSTKLVVLCGLMLVGIGGVWAVVDRIEGVSAQSPSQELPSTALPGTLPNFDHLLQYVGLLVAGVCAAGLTVMARAVLKMR
jgi:hypothetical protein